MKCNPPWKFALLFAVLIPATASADQEQASAACPIEEYIRMTDPDVEAEDDPILDGRGAMPFFMLDIPILATVAPVMWCGGDVESLWSYWRSYRDYYGCDEASDIGQSIESNLVDVPNLAIYAPAREFLADNPYICEEILACELPSDYIPSRFEDDFRCLFELGPYNLSTHEISP